MADLWVFDFDGTLVETAAQKYRAFFEIFPAEHAELVEAELKQRPDASRHDIVPGIVAAIGDPGLDPAELIAAYTDRVAQAVAQAPAVPGAQAALAWCAQHGVACVFSMTPHAELVAALQRRGWDMWLSDISGYPAHKPDTLGKWIEEFNADQVTVVGDGSSDAEAAQLNNAQFLRADAGWPSRLMQGRAS